MDLSKTTGIPTARLSRIESGYQGSVPAQDLERLARALDRPIQFFYQVDRVHVGGACFRYRKQKTLGLRFVQQLEAEVGCLALSVGRLLRQVDIQPETEFAHIDVGDDGDVSTPAEAARWLRHSWGLPHGPVASVVRSIENAGGLVLLSALGTPRVDGLSQWSPPRAPLFVVRSGMPTDRLRFTLAHEIGHVLMHYRPSKGDMEDEADEFATEFLMPAEDISADLQAFDLATAARLKIRWRVSMSALIRRAHQLKFISGDRYRNLMIEMSRQGWRKVEPIQLPPEEPDLLVRIFDFFKSQLGVSRDALPDVMLMSQGSFERFAAVAVPAPTARATMRVLPSGE
jgi:Zn-dependent peptidase ImmA (M78 family)/transcriptional regulator with XRE-family HTH domain